MPVEKLNTFLNFQMSPLFVVKAFLGLYLFFYFIFSILLARQVKIMNFSLKTKISRVLSLVSLLNFVLAIFAFVITIIAA